MAIKKWENTLKIQKMFVIEGIPEIGTQPLEPMHIEKVAITKGQGGVTLQGSFNNLIVHGPSNTTALYTRLVNAKN